MSPIEIVALLALVGYAIYRQTRETEVVGGSRFKLAIIYTAAGLISGVHIAHTFTAYALLVVSLLASLGVQAQKHEFANWNRYAQDNKTIGLPAKGEHRVVLMGNSITDGWPRTRPQFFADNKIIGRGISGQTSYQFLLRFREDVINLHPKVVVINYGTNDIAENTGPYDEDLTFGNVCSMVELARYHKIKVVLASCLPAGGFGWRRSITDSMEKIRSLNERVKAYAKENKIPYVDYFSAMVNAEGTAMRADYANDNPGVHPNAAGYAVMEGLLLPVIEKLR